MDNFKSGFVSVVGLPNVGKSTFINAAVGQKISIISSKPQTTRNKIIAIRTTKTSQIVFIDTPGIHKPRTKLGEFMTNAATGSIGDADVVLFVTVAGRPVTEKEKEIIGQIEESGVPAILVINKIDEAPKDKLPQQIAELNELFDFEATVPVSAKHRDGIEICLAEAEKLLEEGPMFYPEEEVTDMQMRGVVSEIVREKMLRLLDKEIPHGTAVEIITYKEEENIIKISADIYCEKASHKGIIIGKNGEMLKRIGSYARADIEKMTDQKVFLQLWVKVKDDWRNSDKMLKNFGYDNEDI